MPKAISLTPAEVDAVRFALDPMEQYYRELVDEGEMDAVPALPHVEGVALVLPDDPEVHEEVASRLAAGLSRTRAAAREDRLFACSDGDRSGEREHRHLSSAWRKVAPQLEF